MVFGVRYIKSCCLEGGRDVVVVGQSDGVYALLLVCATDIIDLSFRLKCIIYLNN